ncbi:hypothetical protein [Fimbriiglobus ruber]|uniref:Putative metal chaperone, involved in Zn homeostasis, GTPase of COG0523 family n=1 Tax=Fimbriiglobus ruber TaxID=1908690 RepID=A0A225EG85_9BACT|nr:hypothetical protein [Fimbriiglobus ruber]OWK47247.1 putative metal chaperone, involved in Zn homeostasis, GTPase of COG0523 family [Fimbriiglobus ruber]
MDHVHESHTPGAAGGHAHDHASHDHQHHDHDHGHDHNHDHGHGHSHGAGEYFLEQLLTILICGAFGVVAILMWYDNRLDHILANEFHAWVLAGGVTLLVFTTIRAISLWVAAGSASHAHHDHGPDCGHAPGADCGHGHGDHSHDDHEHGGIFWRIVVLAFPILLFIMGLPNSGFSTEWKERRLGKDVELGEITAGSEKAGNVLTFSFDELNNSTNDSGKRAEYEGRTVRVKGQLKKISDREFTLFKMKMNCCAADMIPLKARIKTNSVTALKDYDWVTAEGVLQFVEVPGKNQYMPVIRVKDDRGMQKAQPE